MVNPNGKMSRAPHLQWPLVLGPSRKELEATVVEEGVKRKRAESRSEIMEDELARAVLAEQRLYEATEALQPMTETEAGLYSLVRMVTMVIRGQGNYDPITTSLAQGALEDEVCGNEVQEVALHLADDLFDHHHYRHAKDLYEAVLRVPAEKRTEGSYLEALTGRLVSAAFSVSSEDRADASEAIRALLEADPSLTKLGYNISNLEEALERYSLSVEENDISAEACVLLASTLTRKLSTSKTLKEAEITFTKERIEKLLQVVLEDEKHANLVEKVVDDYLKKGYGYLTLLWANEIEKSRVLPLIGGYGIATDFHAIYNLARLPVPESGDGGIKVLALDYAVLPQSKEEALSLFDVLKYLQEEKGVKVVVYASTITSLDEMNLHLNQIGIYPTVDFIIGDAVGIKHMAFLAKQQWGLNTARRSMLYVAPTFTAYENAANDGTNSVLFIPIPSTPLP